MRALTLAIAILYLPVIALTQGEAGSYIYYSTVIAGDDTMMVVDLGEAVVTEKGSYSKRYMQRYYRIEQKVLKVYPYAKAAGDLMRKYEAELRRMNSEKDRKKYLKLAEEELKSEFEGDIRDMTISEGLILIKLIDRETGENSYELIRELRGSFSAFVWQSVARLFGTNLKEEYDPVEEDQMIEDIVQRIERGELCVPERIVEVPKAQSGGRR